LFDSPNYIGCVSSDLMPGEDFTVGENGMKNVQAAAGFATLAVVLAIGGLGYAHLHLESVLWVFQVAISSIWRVAAGQFAVSLVHAGFLLFPVALATLILAKAVGGESKN
jgi:hypothetical protein